MAVLQLIVMGDAERIALAEGLKGLFPAARDGDPVTWAPPLQADEPAKARLRPLHEVAGPSGLMVKLARLLIATVSVGPRGGAPGLVVAIGDVELNNLDQEALLVAHLRRALDDELDARPDADDRAATRRLLRERGAVHLLRPMVEAPFFGCGAARRSLDIEGLPRLKERDVESFESVDPAWLPECRAKDHPARPWWRHERHAKDYLNHLRKRAVGRRYQETREGTAALRALSWPDAVDDAPAPYLRALFDDLAAWFGVGSPLRPAARPAPTAPTHPASTPAAARLLRNL